MPKAPRHVKSLKALSLSLHDNLCQGNPRADHFSRQRHLKPAPSAPPPSPLRLHGGGSACSDFWTSQLGACQLDVFELVRLKASTRQIKVSEVGVGVCVCVCISKRSV